MASDNSFTAAASCPDSASVSTSSSRIEDFGKLGPRVTKKSAARACLPTCSFGDGPAASRNRSTFRAGSSSLAAAVAARSASFSHDPRSR